MNQKLATSLTNVFGAISSTGLWLNGITDGFLGIKINAAGFSYYGWLRLGVDPTNNSFTVKDYAYNATPNEGIYAGELVSEIQESISHYEIFFSYPAIHFILPYEKQNLYVEIMNVAGEIFTNEILTTNKIDVSDFIPGIYFVKLNDENNMIAIREIVVV